MAKKSQTKLQFSLLLLALILSISLTDAASFTSTVTNPPYPAAIVQAGASNQLFNFSISNTDANQNIMQVNVTLPAGFGFLNGTSGTSAASTVFSNTSTILAWSNTTASGFVASGTVQYFWFNASVPSALGNYSFNITVLDTIGAPNSTLVNVSVKAITLTETLTPAIVNPSDSVTVSGQATLQPDGTNVANNAMNVFLDGQAINVTNPGNWTPKGESQALWQYRKPITINGSTSEQTNYQVLVNLTSSNFNFSKANSQGNDTRFTWLNTTSGLEQNVSFWIESWTASGSSGNATIWVKVPNVAASTTANTTIYMYYGNPSATYNNSLGKNQTFNFVDDFNDNDYTNNPTWSVTAGSWNAASGNLYGSDGSSLTTNSVSSAAEWTWDTKTDYQSAPSNGAIAYTYFMYINSTYNMYIVMAWWNQNPMDGLSLHKVVNGVDTTLFQNNSYNGIPNDVNWHNIKVRRDNSGLFTVYWDNSFLNSATDNNIITSNNITLSSNHVGSSNGRWDNIRVRSYASPEPSVLSVGAEQTTTTTNSTGGYNYTFTAPSSYGTHTVIVNLTDVNGIIGANSATFKVNAYPQVQSIAAFNSTLASAQPYNIGSLVRIRANVSDQNGYGDISSVLLNLSWPNGTKAVANGVMNFSAAVDANTSTYEYNYTLPSDTNTKGAWNISVRANDTSNWWGNASSNTFNATTCYWTDNSNITVSSSVAMIGNCSFGNVNITGTGTINTAQGYGLNLSVNNLAIYSGGIINVSAYASVLSFNSTALNGTIILGINNISLSRISISNGNISATSGNINITFTNSINTSNFVGNITTASGTMNIWYGSSGADRCDASATAMSGMMNYYYAPYSNTTAYRCIKAVVLDNPAIMDSANATRTNFNQNESFYPYIRIREYNGTDYFDVAGTWAMDTYNSNGSVPNATGLSLTNASGSYTWRTVQKYNESALNTYSFLANISGTTGHLMTNSSLANSYTYNTKQLNITYAINKTAIYATDSALINGTVYREPEHGASVGTTVQGSVSGGNLTVTSWWNTSWLYRKAITINGSTSNLSNYQVNLLINSSNVGGNFNWSTYGNDTRFTWLNTTSGQEQNVSFWIENWTSSNALLWVKVPNVSASTVANTTVYMYYGNPSASSASSGTNTFEFFDDFVGTSLDTTLWTVNSGSSSVSNSEITLSTSGQNIVRSNSLFPINSAIRTRVHIGILGSNENAYVGFANNTGRPIAGSSNYLTTAYTQSWTLGTLETASGGTSCPTYCTYGDCGGVGCTFANRSNYNIEEVQRISTASAKFYQNGALINTVSTTIPSGNLPVVIGKNNAAGTAIYDWVLVRKFSSPEPSVLSVGAEQNNPTVTTSSGAYSFTYTPNSSITSITSVNFTLNATDSDGITNYTASPQGAITVYPQIAVDTWASTTSACSGRVSKFNNSGTLFLCANVTYGSVAGLGGENVRFTVYKNGINNEKSQNPVFNVTGATAINFTPAGESQAAWSYRKALTINGSASALTDYQIPINLTTALYNNTGLVGSWHFTNNDTSDSSGYGNNGVQNGGVNCTVTGKVGGGCNFNAADGSHVSVSNSNSISVSGNLTISFWIKPEATQLGSATIISKVNSYMIEQTSGANGYSFGWMSGGLWKCRTIAVTNLTAGTWQQFTIAKAGGTLTQYLNGTPTGTCTDAASAIDTNANSMYVGDIDGTGGNVRNFNGTIDEVRIYNRSLSAAEIAEQYQAGKARLDYQDLRFTWLNTTSNAEQNISYWLESDNQAWVKVPNVAASSVANTTLYMYYGNPSANYNNSLGGNNTFNFFDDFNSYTSIADSAFTSKYNHDWSSGTSSITNGKLYISTYGSGGQFEGWTIKNLSIKDVAIDYNFDYGTIYSSPIIIFRKNDSFSASIADWSAGVRNPGLIAMGQTGDSSVWWSDTYFPKPTLLSIRAYNGDFKVYTDNAYFIGSNTFSNGVPGTIGWQAFSNVDGNSNYIIDNLRIRKYSSPEPSVLSTGSQETLSAIAYTSFTPNESSQYSLNVTAWNANINPSVTATASRAFEFGQLNVSSVNYDTAIYTTETAVVSGLIRDFMNSSWLNNATATNITIGATAGTFNANWTLVNSTGGFNFTYTPPALSSTGSATITINASYGNITGGWSGTISIYPPIGVNVTTNQSWYDIGQTINATATVFYGNSLDNSEAQVMFEVLKDGYRYPSNVTVNTSTWLPTSGSTVSYQYTFNESGKYYVTVTAKNPVVNSAITATAVKNYTAGRINTTIALNDSVIYGNEAALVSGKVFDWLNEGWVRAPGSWWNTWLYRKAITINGSSSSLTDYQTNLTVLWVSGMNTTFGDLRFTYYNSTTQAETAIPHWIESNVSGTNATVWIKTNMTVGSNTIYMYYGNPGATYNNSLGGNNTFLFFDDFEGDTVGSAPGKWTKSGTGNIDVQSVGSKVMRIYPTANNYLSALSSTFATQKDISVHYRARAEEITGESGGISAPNRPDGGGNVIRIIFYPNNNDISYYSGAWLNLQKYTVSTWTTFTVYTNVDADKQTIVINNGTSTYTNADVGIMTPSTDNFQNISFYAYHSGRTSYFDDIYARKYSSPEPSVLSIGSEETQAGATVYLSATGGTILSNVSTNFTGGYSTTYTPPSVTSIQTYTLTANATDSDTLNSSTVSTQIKVYPAPSKLNASIYTDRTYYNLGENVTLAVVMRNNESALFTGALLRAKIYRNDTGAQVGTLDLPEQGGFFAGSYLANFSTSGLTEGWHYINITSEADYNAALPGSGKLFYINPFRLNASLITPSCIPTDQAAQGETQFYDIEARNYTTETLIPGSISSYWNNSRGVRFAERIDANDGVPCSASHTVNIPNNLEEIPGGFSKARFNSTYGGNSARHDLDYMMRYPFWDSDITDTKFLEKRVRIELDNRYNAPAGNALVEITGAELQSAGVDLSTLVLNSTRAVDPRMNGTGANEIRGSALPYNITDSNFNGYIDTNDRIRFLVNLSENERATVYIYYTNLSSGFAYAGTSLSGAAYPYYAVKPLEEAPVLITSLRLDRQIYPRRPTVTLNYSVYTPNPSIPGGPPTTKTYLRCRIYSPNGSLEADTLNILIYNNSYANSISMATASDLFGEYTLACTATDIIAGRLSTYDQKFLEEEIAATVNILPAPLTTTSQTFSVSGNTTLASSGANLSGTFVNVSTLACEATWWRSLFGLGPNCERYQNSTSSGANGGYLTTVTMTIPSDAFTMDVLSNNTHTYTNGTFTASGQIYGANSTQYTVKYLAAVNAWLLADSSPYSPVSIMLQMNTTSTTQQGVNITYEIVNKTSGLSYANLSSDLVTLNTTGGGVNYFTKNWTVDYLPAGEYTLVVRLLQDTWVAGTDSATFYRMNMAHAVNATDTYTDRPVFLNGTIFWPNGTAADESLIINFKGADVDIPAQNIFGAQSYGGVFNATLAVRAPDNSYTLRVASARIMGDDAAKGVSEQAGIKVRLRVLANITANAASYKANTPVNLTLRVNSTANWTVSPTASFNITDRDTFAYAAYNATWNASLPGMAPFENRTRSYIWNTTNNPPGNYTVASGIIDMYGQAAGTANTTVEITTTKTAAISSALGNTTYGMYENANVSGTINRTGNVQFGGNLTVYVKNQNAGTVCSYCSCGTTYYVAVDDAKTTPVSFSYTWNTSSYLAGNYTMVSNFSWVDEDGIMRSVASQNNFTISIVRTADVSVTTSNTTYALTAPAFNITATVANKGNWFTGSGAGGGILSVKAADSSGADDTPTNEVYPSGPWYNTAIPTVCNYNSTTYNYTWSAWTYNNNVLNFKPNGISYVFRKMREADNYTIRANYTFEGGSVFFGAKNITVTQSAAVTMPPSFYLSLKSDPYTSDTNPASRFANEDMWFGLIVTNEGNVQMQNLTANFTVGCSSPSATLGPYSTKTMLNIDDTNVYMLYENSSRAWNTLQTPVNGVQNPCVVNVLLYTPVIYGGCPQVSGTNCVWFDSMTYVPSQTKNLNIKKTESMYFNVSINNNTFTTSNADAVVSGAIRNSGNVMLNGTVSGNIYNLGGSLVASMSCTPSGTINLALAVPQAVNCTWNTGLTEAVNYTANLTYNWGTGSNTTGIPFSIAATKRASVSVLANGTYHNQSSSVNITSSVANIGNYNVSGNLTVRILKQGAVIDVVSTTNGVNVSVGGAQNFSSIWNTGSNSYGQYNITSVYTYLNENGNATNATGSYIITISENRTIAFAMSTDKDSYKSNWGVNITVDLNNTGNAVLNGASLVYTIKQGATPVATYTDNLGDSTVSIGEYYKRSWLWNTSTYAAGTYTVEAKISDSTLASWAWTKDIQVNATRTASIAGLSADVMPPSNYELGNTIYVYGTVNATGNVQFTGNLSLRYHNNRLVTDTYDNRTGTSTGFGMSPSVTASATAIDVGVINLTATYLWIDEDGAARSTSSSIMFYIGGTSVSVNTGYTNTYNPDDAVPLSVHVAGMNGNITGLSAGNFTITDGTNTYSPAMAEQGSGNYLFTFAKNAFGIGDYVIRATVTDPSTGIPGTGIANLYIRDHWITVRVNANSALASSETDAGQGYTAAKLGNALVALVQRGGALDSLSAGASNLVMKQKLSANRFNIVLTQGNVKENIRDRIKLIGSGEFEKYASPSFGFALTRDYHVSVSRVYDAIDIVGVDVGTFRPGMYNLVIRNDGASNGKTKIVIGRK